MPDFLIRVTLACAAIIAALQTGAAQDLGPALQKIKDTGAMTIGYREASIPMSYAEPAQQPIGFALDLCALAVDKVKQTLGLPDLKIAYRPVAEAEAASQLEAGTIDIDCGGTPVSAGAGQQATFSNPIFLSELKWIVARRLRVEREGRRRNYIQTISPSSPDDLKGQQVALTQGSPAVALALTLSNDRSLGLSILHAKDNAESFRLLETGKAAAVLADSVLLLGFKANAKNPDAFGFLDEAYPGTPYALMLRKDGTAFVELVNGAIADAMKSGEYARLYAKWFESPIPPKSITLAYPMPEKLTELVKAAQ